MIAPRRKLPISVWWLGLPLLFIGSFLISVMTTHASRSQSLTTLVTEKQHDSWYYSLRQEPDGLQVLEVEVPQADAVGLQAYGKTNLQLAEVLFAQHPQVEGRVVFVHPLAEKEVPASIPVASAQVRIYELRFRGATGEVGTIFGTPTKEEFLPIAPLHQMATGLSEAMEGGEVMGFVSITMLLDRSLYEELLASPLVGLIDVGPAYAHQEALGEGWLTSTDALLIDYAPIEWIETGSTSNTTQPR